MKLQNIGKWLTLWGAGLLVIGLVCLILPLFWIYSSIGNSSSSGIPAAQTLHNASHVLFVTGALFFVGGMGVFFAARGRK